jgi:hypothetical protein
MLYVVRLIFQLIRRGADNCFVLKGIHIRTLIISDLNHVSYCGYHINKGHMRHVYYERLPEIIRYHNARYSFVGFCVHDNFWEVQNVIPVDLWRRRMVIGLARSISKVLVGMVLVVISGSVLADFRCTVFGVNDLAESGVLVPSKLANVLKSSKFSVDSGTGRVIGGLVQNHNEHGNPKVLDRGSSEQSFKAITIYEPYPAVDYLQINVYSKSNEKPFLFIDSFAGAITGTCVEE